MTKTIVKVSMGVTINTGNFQSVRIDAGIEDFVREGETAESAFNRVYRFVEDHLEQKIKEHHKALASNVR